MMIRSGAAEIPGPVYWVGEEGARDGDSKTSAIETIGLSNSNKLT